jgi:hypothetical protein
VKNRAIPGARRRRRKPAMGAEGSPRYGKDFFRDRVSSTRENQVDEAGISKAAVES